MDAKRDENLILTGRSGEKFPLLKEKIHLENAAADVHVFAVDLSDEVSRAEMTEKIAAEKLKIGRPINAAGRIYKRRWSNICRKKIAFQCRVNFEAAVALCRFAIGVRKEESEIVNIAGVSGIYPMPFLQFAARRKCAYFLFCGTSGRNEGEKECG